LLSSIQLFTTTTKDSELAKTKKSPREPTAKIEPLLDRSTEFPRVQKRCFCKFLGKPVSKIPLEDQSRQISKNTATTTIDDVQFPYHNAKSTEVSLTIQRTHIVYFSFNTFTQLRPSYFDFERYVLHPRIYWCIRSSATVQKASR
jgi:hypothetical protein